MAVGVIFIGRFGADFEAEPDDEGAGDVDEAFHGIGDEGIGIAENPCRELDADEEEIDDQTSESDLSRFGGLDLGKAGGWSAGGHGREM